MTVRTCDTCDRDELSRALTAAQREKEQKEFELVHALETLDIERQQLAAAQQELEAVSVAVGTNRYMDPPDGGSVSLAERVRRMAGHIVDLEQRLEDGLDAWRKNSAASAARVAELERELENERARDIHTCHDQCQRPLCVAQRKAATWEAHAQHMERRVAELEREKVAAMGLQQGTALVVRQPEQREAELREALRTYGWHKPECDYMQEELPCTCGFLTAVERDFQENSHG